MSNVVGQVVGRAGRRVIGVAARRLLAAAPLAVASLMLAPLVLASLAAQERLGPHATARAHAIAGRTDRAIALYDSLRAIVPMDRDAALGAATALAWGKRYAQAEARYRDILARWPDDLEAAQGMARVAAWRGELSAAERQWRALLDRDPENPDLWLGLAQTLRWQDRRAEALGVLERALAMAPQHAEVRAERRRAHTSFANSIEPVLRQSRDSEGNVTWSALITAAVPLSGGHLAQITAVERSAGLGSRAGRARGVAVAAERLFADRGAIALDAGVVLLADAELPSRLLPSGRLRGRWMPTERLRFDGSAGRTVLDETAPLIANAIVMNGGVLAAQLRVRSIWRLAVTGGAWSLRGGALPNQRQEWEAAVVAAPRTEFELGARVRQLQHAQVATDGYFSPRRHDIAEATMRWEPGQSVGWGARFEGALGTQRVTLAGPSLRGPAQRLYLGMARRWELGGQLQLGYDYTSVAGLVPIGTTAPAHYWRHGIVASGRVPLLR